MLKQFYKDIYSWVMSGCPAKNSFGFSVEYGLCFNLNFWRDALDTDPDNDLGAMLKDSFRQAGLAADYPFNEKNTYFIEKEDPGGHFKNVKRLSWIAEHAN